MGPNKTLSPPDGVVELTDVDVPFTDKGFTAVKSIGRLPEARAPLCAFATVDSFQYKAFSVSPRDHRDISSPVGSDDVCHHPARNMNRGCASVRPDQLYALSRLMALVGIFQSTSKLLCFLIPGVCGVH